MTEKMDIEFSEDRLSLDELPILKSVEGYVIIVTGLHEESTEDEVLDTFEEYGRISNIHMNIDKQTGYVKGYALLEFTNINDASDAVNAVKAGDVEVTGNKVEADFAFVDSSTAPSIKIKGISGFADRDVSPTRGN